MKISITGKVFLGCLLLNLFCAAGHNDSVDAAASVDTAVALVERGSFQVPERPHLDRFFARGRNGGHYTKLGVVHPILYIPAVLAGKALGKIKGNEKIWTDFFVSLTNPFFHAILVSLLFFYFFRSGASFRHSLFFSLVTGYGTLLFPYAKTCHREVLQALLLTAIFVIASRPGGVDKKAAWWCGSVAAAVFLVKMGLILPLLPVLVYAALQSVDKSWRRWVPLVIPIVIAGAVWFLYWKGIAGTESYTGYGPRVMTVNKNSAWKTPYWSGIYAQLFSMSHGVFWYSPVLAVAVGIWLKKAFQKKVTRLDLFAILTIVLHASVHAKWFDATGVGPLGPRYLITVIPLFAFALREFPLLPANRLWLVPAVVLLLWSSLLQITFVCVKPQIYHAIRQRTHPVPQNSYEPQWSAMLKIMSHKLRGLPEIYSSEMFNSFRPGKDADLSAHRSYAGFNFWWAHWWRSRK